MYHITTEKRTYNSVDSAEQFKVVRKNWGDHSKVTHAFKWVNPHGWIPVNTHDFEAD